MDYRHHHLVSHPRNILVEAASQRLGGCRHDEREESHDVRNPYTLVSTYQYDPYCNLTSSTGSVANPWRFAAGYFDSSTRLYKDGTRYYDSAIGRWTQQDPLRGSLADPTSLNRYLYVSDDPVNFTDPSGKDTLGWVKAIIASLAAFLYRGTSPCDCHELPHKKEPHRVVQCAITITSTREPGVTLCQTIAPHQN